MAEIRAICFVREFEGGETWKRQRAFLNRPKAAGLWVRVKFRDGEMLEGVMPNNLLGELNGFAIVPPDPTFQSQRIFVPREAVTAVEVLGVIGSPLRRRGAKVDPDEGKQDRVVWLGKGAISTGCNCSSRWIPRFPQPDL